MNIFISRIANRDFLVFEDVISIPVDSIKEIDLRAPNGGCRNSVRIDTTLEGENSQIYWAYDNADAFREFLKENKI